MEVAMPLFIAGVKLDAALKGIERQRAELLGDFSLNLLFGKSSPLYARLYSEGLINVSFAGGTSFFPGGAAAIFGGESRDPAAVCAAVLEEVASFASKGPEEKLFIRLKKAALGDEIRALNSLYGMCVNQANGYFSEFDPLTSIEQIAKFSIGDVTEFIMGSLKPENLALSVVRPMRGE
jgi:predicted Zn-dependent peptidase